MSGELIGATQVMGGNNTLVAVSRQGNLEGGQIDLVFAPGGGAAINLGGNYTLHGGHNQTWHTVCTYAEGDVVHFRVM